MPSARETFVSAMRAFNSAIREPLLTDRGLIETEHNNRARILRNGLAVAVFAMVEAFVKDRIAEILTEAGKGATSFARLPADLQRFCVHNAVRGLSSYAEMLDRNGTDTTSVVLDHSRRIASVSAQPYELSNLGFGYSKSNLNHADVREFLKAFRIENAWAHIDVLAARLGVATPSVVDSFKEATSRRHRAAHTSSAQTTLSDLDAFGKDALVIAISIDALLSACLRRIINADAAYLAGQNIGPQNIQLRFLQETKTGWAEVREGNARASSVNTNLYAAKAAARVRASAKGEVLVLRDRRSVPFDWDTLV